MVCYSILIYACYIHNIKQLRNKNLYFVYTNENR